MNIDYNFIHNAVAEAIGKHMDIYILEENVKTIEDMVNKVLDDKEMLEDLVRERPEYSDTIIQSLDSIIMKAIKDKLKIELVK